jgi:hypothetical protein
LTATSKRSDLGALAVLIARPWVHLRSCAALARGEQSQRFGIEQEKSGQCDYGNREFESIQIKAILNFSLKRF